MLGRVIGAQDRPSDPAANGADHDDPGVARMLRRPPQRGKHDLGDQQLTGEIDLELPSEVIDRQILQGARKCCSGVVDQTEQGAAPANFGTCRPDRVLVQQIHQQWHYGIAELLPELVSILQPSYRRIDRETFRDQGSDARPADPCRGTGDDNRSSGFDVDHSAPAAKVSHVFGSPLRKPWLSHFCRLAAEPCVQLSGETWPCIFSWIRSSPTAAAASTARFKSSAVTSLIGLSGSSVACRNHTPA